MLTIALFAHVLLGRRRSGLLWALACGHDLPILDAYGRGIFNWSLTGIEPVAGAF